MKSLIYLDYAATAPVSARAKIAMQDAIDVVGNPSSIHRAGRAARAVIDQARGALADCIGVGTGQIIFTSSGTEANAMAMSQRPRKRRYASRIEHEAVRAWIAPDNLMDVTCDGVIDLKSAEQFLRKRAPGLVSFMLVNNATGVIQPVRALADAAKACDHVVHCDAVQAFGKLPFTFDDLNVDLLSISAHKIGGPKGVGALITRDGLPLETLMQGGGQERRRRPGTENVIGIAGFGGAVADLDGAASYDHIRDLSSKIVGAVSKDNVAGAAVDRVPHILSVRMPGVKNQLQLMRFDLEGICVSAGSACSSGKVAGNHVLEAMDGIGPVDEYIRVSIGRETTRDEIDAFCAAWDKLATASAEAA